MDITEIILWAVVVWVLSQILLGFVDAFQIVKLKERVDILKQLTEIIHQVKVEERDGMEYWYDADSEAFLAQGKTIDDIINVIKARFPDHIFLIQDAGGVSKQTNWKLMPPEEFNKIAINLDNTK
jgi:hypothetical protein